MLFARGGDVASMDVVIPPKNTGIAPGPMLTDFKENNIPYKDWSRYNLDYEGNNSSKERRTNFWKTCRTFN